ncbi:hypothetical protein RJ639_009187 [Escallonia herrerae]|uniref:Reverse transcriptase/retrotransposon-derived protein RNase H-like domain-containing protein n=1 Tax=Escallonia herrerae TaxID=1293975 RepID=A0AA88VRJ6_9ASTE|nr:hypothetical protein RJ639_009187 [Escallonia herrerae]
MKFLTPQGFGFVRGDWTLARRCYVAFYRAEETLSIDDQRYEKTIRRAKPMEALISVPLIKEDDERQLQIGSTLEPNLRDQLISFLRSNVDIFAWSATDMSGIDQSVITHQLSVDPRHKPALKNIKNFEWTSECRASFDALKEYLASPPLLSNPFVGEELFLYLAVAESTVSAVLIREQDGPIYYMRKVLQGAELRYPNAEKLAFALLIAAKKLRPYF